MSLLRQARQASALCRYLIRARVRDRGPGSKREHHALTEEARGPVSGTTSGALAESVRRDYVGAPHVVVRRAEAELEACPAWRRRDDGVG